jgi:hypothetical protein
VVASPGIRLPRDARNDSANGMPNTRNDLGNVADTIRCLQRTEAKIIEEAELHDVILLVDYRAVLGAFRKIATPVVLRRDAIYHGAPLVRSSSAVGTKRPCAATHQSVRSRGSSRPSPNVAARTARDPEQTLACHEQVRQIEH